MKMHIVKTEKRTDIPGPRQGYMGVQASQGA